MKRLIIVCKGQTEQCFCEQVLAPYFLSQGIMLVAPVIKRSNGGIVPWQSLKQQLLMHLYEQDVLVSMLIDYYGIKDSYHFPGWEEAKHFENGVDKMNCLFQRMVEDFPMELKSRFVPYIQLHEFEGLLFSDISTFKTNFDAKECDFDAIESAMDGFASPEDINNTPETAPSSRLKRAIQGYDKVVYGSILAEELGLKVIREKCPIFNSWIERIEEKVFYGSNKDKD